MMFIDRKNTGLPPPLLFLLFRVFSLLFPFFPPRAFSTCRPRESFLPLRRQLYRLRKWGKIENWRLVKKREFKPWLSSLTIIPRGSLDVTSSQSSPNEELQCLDTAYTESSRNPRMPLAICGGRRLLRNEARALWEKYFQCAAESRAFEIYSRWRGATTDIHICAQSTSRKVHLAIASKADRISPFRSSRN